MQIHHFTNGGFVIHHTIDSRKVSAWYDQDGTLTDSEKPDELGRSRRPSKYDTQIMRMHGQMEASRKRGS